MPSWDGVERSPSCPRWPPLWADAVRYGRAALPGRRRPGADHAAGAGPFNRCLIVATANLGREQVAHIGFPPREVDEVGRASGRRASSGTPWPTSSTGPPARSSPPDQWIVRPPPPWSERTWAPRRSPADGPGTSCPRGAPPPIEITPTGAERLIEFALRARLAQQDRGLGRPPPGDGGPAVDGAPAAPPGPPSPARTPRRAGRARREGRGRAVRARSRPGSVRRAPPPARPLDPPGRALKAGARGTHPHNMRPDFAGNAPHGRVTGRKFQAHHKEEAMQGKPDGAGR